MSKRSREWIGYAALLAAVFLIVRWAYAYVLLIRSETPASFFVFTRGFFLGFLNHPGGALRYAGRFLEQFDCRPNWASLAAAGCVTCFAAAFLGVLRTQRPAARFSETLFPCVLMAALHASPGYSIEHTLGAAVACAAGWGLLSWSWLGRGKVAAFLAMPVLYVLAGAYAWLPAAWVLLDANQGPRSRRGLAFKCGFLLWCAALPVIAYRWVFLIPLRSAAAYPFSLDAFSGMGLTGGGLTRAVDAAAGAALGLWLVAAPFWSRVSARWRWFSDDRPARGWLRRGEFVAIGALLLVMRHDGSLEAFARRRRLYRSRRWEQLLTEARRTPQRGALAQFMTNCALAHTGRLLDEMFQYPQDWGVRGLLLPIPIRPVLGSDQSGSSRALYNADIFFEMGHINLALLHAFNYVTLQGETYEALARLAECYMVNDRAEMAAKHLRRLERTLWRRSWARRRLRLLAEPAALSQCWARERMLRPNVERRIREYPPAALAELLEARADNRLAFDYLMAWLLLSKRGIAALPRDAAAYRRAGYKRIPTHCQEAILLLAAQKNLPWRAAAGVCDPAVSERVSRFMQEFLRFGQRDDAEERFRARYAGSYLFYYYFTPTPDDARWLAERFGSAAAFRSH